MLDIFSCLVCRCSKRATRLVISFNEITYYHRDYYLGIREMRMEAHVGLIPVCNECHAYYNMSNSLVVNLNEETKQQLIEISKKQTREIVI